MRNADTYRGARKQAAKTDHKVWRLVPFERRKIGKRMNIVIKNCPKIA